MTRAIIFVPSGEFEPHASIAMQHCAEQGYNLHAIVRDDWKAVQNMLDNDEATVAIVSDFKHLDPNRKPRVEIAESNPARKPDDDDPDDPWRRRPRNRRT
jgi:hypothetical protein